LKLINKILRSFAEHVDCPMCDVYHGTVLGVSRYSEMPTYPEKEVKIPFDNPAFEVSKNLLQGWTGYCEEGGLAFSSSVYDSEVRVHSFYHNPYLDVVPVAPQSRKLKAVWSREAQEDLRAVHNIDAAAKLSEVLAREIVAEIDAEVIEDISNNVDPYYMD